MGALDGCRAMCVWKEGVCEQCIEGEMVCVGALYL